MEAREYFDDDRESNKQLAAAELKLDRETIEERKRQEAAAEAGKPEVAAEAAPSQDAGTGGDDGHLKSIGDRANGGGIVVGTGARLADDRSWEKDYDAMRDRQAIVRAGRLAAQDAQRELLSSGKYFDDGRGNIKLKKQYRSIQRVGNGGRRTYNDTVADDGSAARYIANARRLAMDAASLGLADGDALNPQGGSRLGEAIGRTRSAIAANRMAERERLQEDEKRKSNEAKGRLSVFDGFASALNSLRRNTADAEGDIMSVWGGKDEDGRDARWKHDEQGRVIGQADARQTPRPKGDGTVAASVRTGFVEPREIRSINANLRQRGANYALTGIMARQPYGAIGKPMEGTDPVFYVQGVKNDGSQFGRYMTMKDVYRMGVENYRAANGAAAKDGDAEQFATEGLGGYDPYGFVKRRETDVKTDFARMNAELRERIAKMNNQNRLDVAREKAQAAQAAAQFAAEATKYKADANERIAKIRAARGKFRASDLKDVAEMMTSPLYDDETKRRAKEAFDYMADRLTGKGESQPPPTGETRPMQGELDLGLAEGKPADGPTGQGGASQTSTDGSAQTSTKTVSKEWEERWGKYKRK